MLVLGLHVGKRGSRRVIRGVLLDASTDSLVSPHIEHVPNPSHDESTQTHEARDAFAGALSGLDLAGGVLLESDYHPQARVTGGTRNRLRLEGAVLSACRVGGAPIAVMNGKELGHACGGKKDDAFLAARNLGVDEELVEATAAALAAKSLL